MSKMIERVAKAIVKSYLKAEVPEALNEDIDEAVNRCYHEWIIHAKDAIQAMREPTQEMLFVGSNDEAGFTHGNLLESWRLMIDEALK